VKSFLQPVIHNGLSNGSAEWIKVQDTVVQQNQTPINDEVAVYRVVKIEWDKLITSIDNSSTGYASGSNVRRNKRIFSFSSLFIIL